MRSAKENCQKDVQIRCINWRSQSGKLKRLPPMGLWIHAAPMHRKAAMHRTKPKDCVEMNAYFNDQSYEYQTRIIIMAENLYLHLKLALPFLLGAVATINKGASLAGVELSSSLSRYPNGHQCSLTMLMILKKLAACNLAACNLTARNLTARNLAVRSLATRNLAARKTPFGSRESKASKSPQRFLHHETGEILNFTN